ncbi:hypothetical protein B0H13DRAFT_2325927 [Mycena leptocephala]|nr:hypothetical protein B0H13DRAFT_2325927 [Mycena leptocephala]
MSSGSAVLPTPLSRAPANPPIGPASNTRDYPGIVSPPHPPAAAPITSFDHFQLHPPSKKDTTKVAAEKTEKNIAIIADVIRGIETCVDGATRDIANLTSEVRLRPQQAEYDAPRTTWNSLYGINPLFQSQSPSPTHDQSRSQSIPSPTGPELLEDKQDADRNTLDARIAILEGRHSSTNDGMTVSDLQESAVQRFDAISRDLQFLDDERAAHVKGLAAISQRADALENVNLKLQKENELAPPRALGQIPVASSVVQPPKRRQSPPAHTTQRRTQSHGRSLSPPPDSKRARTAITPLPKGFITFGPVAESSETNLRLFELHLRTAIPRFTLQGPYDVRRDPIYSHSLRVTVTDESAARALVEAWMQHSVEGYANIKMVQMADATGNTSVNLHSSAPNRGIDRNSNPAQTANRSQRHSEPSRR